MKWVPLIVVLGLVVALLLTNRQIRGRTGRRLLRTNVQSDIFGGLFFFLLLGSISYALGSSALRAFVTSAIGGVGMFLLSRWQRRRRTARQR